MFHWHIISVCKWLKALQTALIFQVHKQRQSSPRSVFSKNNNNQQNQINWERDWMEAQYSHTICPSGFEKSSIFQKQ
jgi:hypothetical protein